jgi:RNA ligase
LRDHDAKISIQNHYNATPLFEIIYAANRIVVDYAFESLVVLGLVYVHSGRELSRMDAEDFADFNNLPIVKKFNKTLAECAAENTPNAEGYVLTYPNAGLKVKVKFEEYVRLHRILTGLNPRTIWEMLAEKQDPAVDSIMKDPKLPAKFLEWFGGWVNQLRGRYTELERISKQMFEGTPHMGEGLSSYSHEQLKQARKENALYYLQAPALSSILFAMLDGKDYGEIIWKIIKPRGDETFKKDGE